MYFKKCFQVVLKNQIFINAVNFQSSQLFWLLFHIMSSCWIRLQFHAWHFFFSSATSFLYSLLQILLVSFFQVGVQTAFGISEVSIRVRLIDCLTTQVAKVSVALVASDVIATVKLHCCNLAPLVGAFSDH
jgi:hypothetical protein